MSWYCGRRTALGREQAPGVEYAQTVRIVASLGSGFGALLSGDDDDGDDAGHGRVETRIVGGNALARRTLLASIARNSKSSAVTRGSGTDGSRRAPLASSIDSSSRPFAAALQITDGAVVDAGTMVASVSMAPAATLPREPPPTR